MAGSTGNIETPGGGPMPDDTRRQREIARGALAGVESA